MHTIGKGNASPAVYRKLRTVLADRISSGEWRPGDRISPEGVLADTFKVSRTTIRRALSGLERDGMILRFPGKGTFVNHTNVPAKEQFHVGIDFFTKHNASHSYYGAIAEGILDEARQNDISVFLLHPEEYDQQQMRTPDGYIFVHRPNLELPLFGAIAKGIIPAIGFNYGINRHVGLVAIDNQCETQRGVEFLIARGHRKIAYYGNPPITKVSAARYAGWQEAMQTAGLEFNKRNVHFYDAASNPFAQAETFLHESGVTALFVSTAALLSPVLAAMNRLKICMPDDMQILCFDDLSPLGLDWPGIAYIKMPLYEIGRRMLDALRQKIILGERAPEINEKFQAEIVCCPPAPECS
jgi:DNA-binding LacI/PurR family transcriptional regulator